MRLLSLDASLHMLLYLFSKHLTDIPMLADVGGVLSKELGILNRDALVSNRATFIIDPDGIIRFVSVTDLSVGRNPDEVLRVLDALQTDELCPCNWKKSGLENKSFRIILDAQ